METSEQKAKQKYKVGIPRALHFYRYFPFWKKLLEELDVELILSPPTNKKIVEEGVTHGFRPVGSCTFTSWSGWAWEREKSRLRELTRKSPECRDKRALHFLTVTERLAHSDVSTDHFPRTRTESFRMS